MDPLYSYSMGIALWFPNLLIYYHHYVSCCNPTEVDFSAVLWQQIRTLKLFWSSFRLFTLWIILLEQRATHSSSQTRMINGTKTAMVLLWQSKRLCDLNSYTITWKGSQEQTWQVQLWAQKQWHWGLWHHYQSTSCRWWIRSWGTRIPQHKQHQIGGRCRATW